MPPSPKGKEKALPNPPLDEYATGPATPRSAVISIPPDWSLSNSPNGSSSRSEEGHRAPPSSTSSRLSFDQLSDKSNPFESPFDSRRTSSSSQLEDEFQSTPQFRQPSAFQNEGTSTLIPYPTTMRSTTDPNSGLPLDTELVTGDNEFDFDEPPVPPAFNRTFSAPLPNRVGYLRHPLSPSSDPLGCHSAHPPRSTSTSTSFSALANISSPHSTHSSRSSEALITPPNPTPMQALSMEFADTLQSAIQTLLHLSPPHLLDNAKEQYSGCTVQMPTTSLSALLSSMRSLNYLSANIQPLIEDSKLSVSSTQEEGLLAAAALKRREDFDVGELLQSVADLLGGQAAQAGVDLVLFHGDVGIKHVSVTGDGEGLGYLLGHIIRQILLVAKLKDTLELGLQVIPQSPSMTPRVAKPLTAADIAEQKLSNRPPSPGQTISLTSEGPLLCVFEITHNIYQTPESAATTPKAELNPFTQLVEQRQANTPNLDTILCRRLLQHQNARLKLDAQVSSPLADSFYRRAYELTVLLPRGKPMAEPASLTNEEEAVRQPYSHMKLAREPTLVELSNFADSLRSKKVVLHASLSSVFARHLTSYLGAWGMDISHVPLEEEDQEPRLANPTELSNSMASLSLEPGDSADKFIIVDDNVDVLKRELLKLKAENTLILKPKLSKRPTLLGRTKSSPLVRQTPKSRSTSTVLIHFTSLSNYNQVRDIVSSYLGAPSSTLSGAFVYPEVMVIPKPVGPRRFLTALHTAINQPIVDPYFSPIATSPRSPGGMYMNGSLRTPSYEYKDGFFGPIPEVPAESELLPPTVTQKARSPLGEHPPRRSSAGTTPTNIVSTPADEYFSGAMGKSGSGSAVVMSSPDGRPFGMFFEPPKSERRSSSNRLPPIRRSTSRQVSSASQHQVSDTDKKSSGQPSPSGSRSGSRSESRRTSAVTIDSRRSSQSKVSDEIQLTKKERRKTKKLPQDDNPIIAKGRNRSGTLTKEGILKSTQSFVSSPTSLKHPEASSSEEQVQEDRPIVQREKSFIAPKSTKKANPVTLDDIQRMPGTVQVKKEKEDVVVPPINVLIVEDNPINQNILSMFLRKKKIKHSSAKDGLEAVEKWRTGGFHLILMDIQLPVMDGIAATKEIRKLEKNNNIGVFPMTPASETYRSLSTPTQETPNVVPTTPLKSSVIIVALTASSLQSDRVNALAAGCNDFLTKPVSLKWLEKKIVEWGCMQALIDFDGWRRWKSADPKDSISETKKGFQTGPQAAALSLANRLKINPDKKSARQTSISSINSNTSTLDSFPRPPHLDIRVQTATPPLITDPKDLSASPVGSTDNDEKEEARKNLKEARNELMNEVGTDSIPEPLSNGEISQPRPTLITDLSGSNIHKEPSPAPDLEIIQEASGIKELEGPSGKEEVKKEKDLPALPEH